MSIHPCLVLGLGPVYPNAITASFRAFTVISIPFAILSQTLFIHCVPDRFIIKDSMYIPPTIVRNSVMSPVCSRDRRRRRRCPRSYSRSRCSRWNRERHHRRPCPPPFPCAPPREGVCGAPWNVDGCRDKSIIKVPVPVTKVRYLESIRVPDLVLPPLPPPPPRHPRRFDSWANPAGCNGWMTGGGGGCCTRERTHPHYVCDCDCTEMM